MPASEDRPISEFPIALQLTNRALVFLSAPDGLGGYDSVHAELTEIGRIVLETQYTQDLGNMDVFTAIKNCRVLSGTTNPTSAQGADGQMYVKYQTVSNVDEVVGLYVKLNGEWVEISTGGSGGDVGIECTQAQYDAWEQAGTLLEDTNYYITDGQSGGGVVIDDTSASRNTVFSSAEVEDLLSDKQDATDNSLDTTDKTIVGAINELKSGLTTTNSKIDYLRSKFYLGNCTTFTFTMPDIRDGGDNFNHMTMVIGNNAFAILCCSYGQSTVSVTSLGSNTITATKSANSFDVTVKFNDTSWGGIRVITLD